MTSTLLCVALALVAALVAGPAFAESLPELGPKGGTGFAVRTLVRYLIGLTDPGPSS